MPSGLTRTSVVSRAMRRPSLAFAAGLLREIVERRQPRWDVRRAVRAHLPETLERLPARRARRTEPRGADRADEVRRLDPGATDRAALVELCEPLLHRLDLELALARILEILGRPEEHVDDRAEEGREEPGQRRDPDDTRPRATR